MSDSSDGASSRFDPVEVDLKNRVLAAVLGWLWPGAGHLYQRRYAKGALFMVCILGTYFWGLSMGAGHVVYASLRPGDRRLYYAGQVHVGIPALLAIPQAMSMASTGRPVFGDWMAPPRLPLEETVHDHRSVWHEQLGFYFELGTLFTTVAGLLNLLAVYDAFAGPVFGPWPSGEDLPRGDPPAPPPGWGVRFCVTMTSGLGFFGGVFGFLLALVIRSKIDIDSDVLGFACAVGGIFLGWAAGRGLRWLLLRQLGIQLVFETDDDGNG